jgi:hypothetical protein
MKHMTIGVILSIAACLACNSRRVELKGAAPGSLLRRQAPPAAEPSAIDPRVDEMVRAVADRLRAVQSFRMRVADTLDEVEDNGQKLQYSHVREVIVHRPDRIWAQTRGDLVNRTLWKDGRSVTLFDPEQLIYARIDDPGTNEQMMDVLLDEYGFSTPMADLLSDDVHGAFTEGATSARYLGEHLVGEELCHHLAFDHPDVDWQLWLSTGDAPELRKLVITYADDPGAPQYSMSVLLFEPLDEDDVPDSLFVAQIPEEAHEIELVPLDTVEDQGR